MQYRYVVDYIPTIYYLIQRGANIKDPNLHSLLQKQQKTQVAKDNVERITQIINAQHKKYEEFKKFVRKHTKEQCKALAKGEKEDIIREGLLAKILTEKTTKKFRIANMDETQPLPALLAKKLNDIAQQEIQKISEHYNKENSIFSRVLTKILNLLAKLSISLAEKLKDTK